MTSPVVHRPSGDYAKGIFESISADGGSPDPRSDRHVSTRTFAVAMLPRTGSTALCSLLARTGLLGMPEEYLNPRGPLQHWSKELKVTDAESYFDSLRRERTTENGVFGLKTTFDDFRPLLETSSARAFLGEIRFIYLTRTDLLSQAISEYMAEESGIWHRDPNGNPLDSTAVKAADDVEFNQEKILQIVDRFVAMQVAWERFFVLYGVSPLRISYEQLCDDAAGVVSRIAAFVGVEWQGTMSLGDAATSKLSDARAAEWVARIRMQFAL
jgi:LPS sulfotransferase NodH